MKTMTSEEAQHAFCDFLDTSQREPVMVTRKNHPVGVMLAMNNLPALLQFADDIRETIKKGVKVGLADAEAGRTHQLTDEYVEHLRLKAKQRAGCL